MEQIHFRKAFSMLTAIVVIVLMATVAIFVMNLSGKIIKSTTAQYQHEQALLYAKSYTEYAILAITGNDRSSNCLRDIGGTIKTDSTSPITVSNGNGYRIRVRISYIGNSTELNTCKTQAAVRVLSDTVTTIKTPLSVIIDAYVDYKDPDNPSGPWMTVHRRTVQKI